MQQLTRDDTGEQISRLRQQLAERDLAIVRAKLAATELHQKISNSDEENEKLKKQLVSLEEVHPPEAVEEIGRLKREWAHAQKALQNEQHERRTELVNMRSQLHQTQKKFDEEHRARRSENAQSSATIARLERDLSDLRSQGNRTLESQSDETRKRWKMITASLAAFILVTALAFWTGREKTAEVTREPVRANPPERTPSVRPVPTPFSPSSHDFSRSLGRLNEAVLAFPNRTPEAVLAAVHAQNKGVCAFVWNNGQPSMMFSRDHARLSLVSTLNSCADAVENYAAQKQNAPASPPGH